MRAVRKHTDCPWVLLYLERWLRAPVQMADGSLIGRERGTPQGGVVGPLLANLFLHYAFDMWMRRNHPAVPFERYADDAICHCRNEEQARALRASLERRFVECGLTTSSIFSATHSGRGCRDDGGVASASRSARRPATRLSRRSGRRSEAGRFMSAATSRSTTWSGCSIATSGVGSTTTAGTTNRRSTLPCDTST
jgi:hypothetical protein